MSGYRPPPPAQFDDTEIERRIQEEIRRRAMQQVVPFPSVDHSVHPAEYSPHISILKQAAAATQRQQQQKQQQQDALGTYPGYSGPTGAIPHGLSPYSMVANFAGIADARAAAYSDDPLVQMYAARQERQRQANISANNYAVAAAYGTARSSPLTSGHPGIDHHYAAAYNNLGPPQASTYVREASYGSAAPSLHEANITQHTQSQHIKSTPITSDPCDNPQFSFSHKDNNAITGEKLDTPGKDTPGKNRAPTSTPTISGGKATPSSRVSSVGLDSLPNGGVKIIEGVKSVSSPNADGTSGISGSTPSKEKFLSGSIKTPKSSAKKSITSSAGKEKTSPNNVTSSVKLTVIDGKTVVEDGDQRWYVGCVPLGIDDDKYWLSELQVYLRSNMSEVFGASDDDIAAPMHGRNKPIAFGQVGIRCMHCKRKYSLYLGFMCSLLRQTNWF